MPEKQANKTGVGASDLDQSELAHSIIESLLDHTRVVSDLIALMAQALDQDTTKALTQTPQWQAYLESRRELERTRGDVEKFAKIMKQVGED
ncbi:MAG: hypothetical protein DMF75_15715 [Acidobacteria bacterium]|nr:MAG: hypothetical protein DMF75_15715 [Acidobacteriota bacterium]PYS64678.1 MAG: hypothetical protein DMF76_04265 [Acidobacteriota bacterium]